VIILTVLCKSPSYKLYQKYYPHLLTQFNLLISTSMSDIEITSVFDIEDRNSHKKCRKIAGRQNIARAELAYLASFIRSATKEPSLPNGCTVNSAENSDEASEVDVYKAIRLFTESGPESLKSELRLDPEKLIRTFHKNKRKFIHSVCKDTDKLILLEKTLYVADDELYTARTAQGIEQPTHVRGRKAKSFRYPSSPLLPELCSSSESDREAAPSIEPMSPRSGIQQTSKARPNQEDAPFIERSLPGLPYRNVHRTYIPINHTPIYWK
jgi:hypothetical protein